MSQETVEVVRRAFAAYEDGGIEVVMPLFAPGVAWYFDADELVDDLAYRGRDGLRAAYDVWVSGFEDFGWDVHEIRELGDRVLVMADITGVARETGVAARLSTNLLVEVRGDLIVEVHTFTDLERAVEAAEPEDKRVSQENVEVVRRGFEHFRATGGPLPEILAPEFVWDMSTFRGWPEKQTYEGPEGTQQFLTDWMSAFEDWRIKLEEIHDAGDQVVAICRQTGRSKLTGVPVNMAIGQVFTLRDGLETRMEMYADPAEAMRAAGLVE
ncbi:MAG TPA: nuclear transport factor 2 family protein [Gemmatimonadales bacterium]|nr:nuclear transport factor 2 family protein [Gemmatimonadales bacterium]